jgi:1-phosphofructokinase
MIVTLTLNPSLDRTIQIGRLERGAVLRAASVRLEPGGKGVNVSRALLANAVASRAVVPCGGQEGDQLVGLLADEGVEWTSVPVAGRTRSNVTLAEPDGTVTKINEPGAPLTADELETIAATVLAAGRSASWLVVCGRLPPGVPADWYAGLCDRCAAAGIPVAVDTSGPALAAAVRSRPLLVKPNRDELAEAVGAPIRTLDDAVDGALLLRSWGAGSVLVSLGADGAVLVSDGLVATGHCPVPEPRSTVGAGDALLAGFLAGGAHGPDALAHGLAWAAAAVGLPGSRMPGPADIRHDTVTIRPQLTRPLTPPLAPPL